MPVNIPASLPARATLENENIFVMGASRARRQDIRPLRVAILNLMPTKIATETQLLRLLGNTPLQVDVTLLHMATHDSKNTPGEHLLEHYRSFAQVRQQKFDGLIITGAPVETLPFEQVDYWQELTALLDWAETNVYATLYICWGAQAGLYHQFRIPKYPLPEKMFGVYAHTFNRRNVPLLRGYDDVFYAPHSRHTEIRRVDIEPFADLDILSESELAGVYLVMRKDGRQIFVTGHSEYDPLTLKGEYDRDVNLGKHIHIPLNYYTNDDPSREPVVRWRGHSNLLFSNWLNYYVYQETPFNLDELN